MELVEYPDRELMMINLADRLASELRSALRNEERVTFSVPGGTTPGPVFDVLCGLSLDWARVRILPNDERWVGEDSPRSNARLLRERLLRGTAAAATLIPLHVPTHTPEEAAAEVAEAVRGCLPVSVLLLGMGEDMHTASLFPGADRLAEALDSNAPPVLPMRAPGAAEPRMTLTAPVLQGALNTHILITGAAKRAAVERARQLSPSEAPVRTVLGEATVHWAE